MNELIEDETKITSWEIGSDLRLCLQPSSLECDGELNELVDHIWEEAIKQNKNLYDSSIACVIKVDLPIVYCTLVPYRFIFAKRCDPRIKQALSIRSLAVSGLILDGRQVVFGKRSAHVTQYANSWELVPSGSIDAGCSRDGVLCYKSQLLQEFEEELGLPKTYVQSVESVRLIYDPTEECLDVGCLMRLNSVSELEWPGRKSKEYSEFRAVSLLSLADFLIEYSQSLVPTSVELAASILS